MSFKRLSDMRLALLLCLSLLLLTGCKSFLTNNEAPSISGIAPVNSSAIDSVEREIGRKEHPKIVKAYGGVYNNEKVEMMVAKLVGRLVQNSVEPNRPYRVTILNSPTVNAFALPGGYLYVTRGLLALANDKAELAAVLAHEMAHVTSRHAIARAQALQKNKLLSRVMDNMVGQTPKTASIKARNLVTLATFSQVQELEADRLGIETTFKSGLDPFAASRFLSTMGRYAQFLTGQADNDPKANFLSSHPTTPERIKTAIYTARRYGGPSVGAREREDYLDAIDGILYGDAPDEGFVRGYSYIHPLLRIRFTLPQGYRLENTTKAVLAVAPDGTAMRFDGVNVSPDVPLTKYLMSGWVTGLLTGSIREQTINGLPAVLASAKAKGWTFRIAIIRVQSATYRFVFATTDPNPSFESAVAATVNSFQTLSFQQAHAFKPLTISVTSVGRSDSVEKLASEMEGVTSKEALFRIINDLKPSDGLRRGQRVKLVKSQD
ncbi:Putative Zn-dependent protease [Cohaesibacter sp. ES.047]|uniref:M48 family metalloprotease n=1 Tax=Cohaesibacter sp. ES.047 TaxID=1798205 RepID=UPI000BB79ECA|nr:M48 family metalloprotease [Cohaesibacter sp. ES.047]SNY90873.1 Putative Zn-dependent protease [Cohaesibacter sp. ES.047]